MCRRQQLFLKLQEFRHESFKRFLPLIKVIKHNQVLNSFNFRLDNGGQLVLLGSVRRQSVRYAIGHHIIQVLTDDVGETAYVLALRKTTIFLKKCGQLPSSSGIPRPEKDSMLSIPVAAVTRTLSSA